MHRHLKIQKMIGYTQTTPKTRRYRSRGYSDAKRKERKRKKKIDGEGERNNGRWKTDPKRRAVEDP